MLRRLGRALRLRCPRCGGGAIFAGFGTTKDTCPTCGLRFERQEGFWVGAVAVNTVATIVVFAAVFVGWIVFTWPEPPWTAIGIGVVALNIVFPIVFYPWSKTIWLAIDLTAHPEPPVSLPRPPAGS
jgi:uncharacterized protein (DUF983 family)